MVLNRNNLPEDWGPSALNAEHQASLSADYELPFGHRQALGWLATERYSHSAERFSGDSAGRLQPVWRWRH